MASVSNINENTEFRLWLIRDVKGASWTFPCDTTCTHHIRDLLVMSYWYINLHFAYLLAYLFTSLLTSWKNRVTNKEVKVRIAHR